MNALTRFSVRLRPRRALPLLQHHQRQFFLRPRLAPLRQQTASRLVSLSSFSSNSPVGSMNDLAVKHCVPCNSKDICPMSEHSAHELLETSELGIHGWSLLNEDDKLKLQKSWKVKSFTKGLEFFKIVAEVAEAEGHHPDLHLVGWNNVKVDLWTHSVGGLTENDFILAAKISTLNVGHLLRREAAK